MLLCCRASETLISPARPAVLSEWPIIVLTPPTISWWESLGLLVSLGKKAVRMASASTGSPAGVPVPIHYHRQRPVSGVFWVVVGHVP